ncbi:MAG: biliverdin-producing heme oxygenase, partial [Wenzhouxiangella sp.]
DLAALGVSPAEPALDGFAPPDSVSEWLGQAYVLEGSRLGSAVIVCRVAGILGEQVPRRFLAATQEDYAWPRLLFVLEAKLDTPAKLQSAIEAACSAFAAYRCTLDVLQDC